VGGRTWIRRELSLKVPHAHKWAYELVEAWGRKLGNEVNAESYDREKHLGAKKEEVKTSAGFLRRD